MQRSGFNSFSSSMIKLSVNETQWSSLLARTRALILYISIWKFDFGPEKLPGLSRNGLLQGGQKRARPSKKVWFSGLGLCLEMSLVFDFGQGLRCGLSIRRCRCHWIMGAWFVFLHFFLVHLCWYTVSERQMLLFFPGGLVGVDKDLFQRVSLITSMTPPLNYIFVLLLANVDVIPKQKQLSTV